MHVLPQVFTSSMLAGALVDSCWQAVALTAGTALALRLVPALSAAARSAIWTGVLAVMLLLPVLSLLLPHPLRAPAHTLHIEARGSEWLLAVWAGACAFRFAQFAMGALRLRTVLRRSVPITGHPQFAASLEYGRRAVRLCTSDDVQKPSVAGFFRPRILLPPALLIELSPEELRQIVLHECAHLHRGDDWINLLQQVALVLLPLNPALLWLNRRLSLERELACDDRVLAATRARKAYAACLARVAENSLVQRGVSLALGILGRRPELVHRVERILRAPRPAMGRLQTRFASGALLAALAGSAGVLAHCPGLVTFSETPPLQAQAAVASPLLDVAGSAHVVLAKATLPAAGEQSAVFRTAALSPTARVAQKPTHQRLRSARQRHLAPRPHVLLTDWQATKGQPEVIPAVRLTRVLVTDGPGTPVWYTAIAWRDGWLVVQL